MTEQKATPLRPHAASGEQQKSATAEEAPKYLWRSGELVEWERATVHISTLGWSAISSVFEGIRAYWDSNRHELYVFQLEAHLKRLFQSMKIMRMTSPYPPDSLSQAIIDLLRANEYRCDAYIQPLAYFGRRDTRLPGGAGATRRGGHHGPPCDLEP